MARRSGDKWWVSGINGSDEPRKGVKLNLSRLHLNLPTAHGIIFSDSPHPASASDQVGARPAAPTSASGNISGSAAAIAWDIKRISNSREIPTSIDFLPRGGFVMVIGE